MRRKLGPIMPIKPDGDDKRRRRRDREGRRSSQADERRDGREVRPGDRRRPRRASRAARRRRRRARRRSAPGGGDDGGRRRPAGRRPSASCWSASSTRWASTRRSRSSTTTRPCTGTVHGEDLGLFIGRHGQTIDAVQHLAQRVVGRARASTAGASSSTPRATASGARCSCAARPTRPPRTRCATGRPVALDAMTASERRLVHEYLRDRGAVQTYSEGDEPDRHLVVAPLKP